MSGREEFVSQHSLFVSQPLLTNAWDLISVSDASVPNAGRSISSSGPGWSRTQSTRC